MKSMFTMAAAMFATTQVFQEAEAVKILMAGDFDADHRFFFESTGQAISKN